MAAAVLVDPADWPPSVTLPGSPPNAAMLRYARRKASSLVHQSMVPKFALGIQCGMT
jgi:hypothetical protein